MRVPSWLVHPSPRLSLTAALIAVVLIAASFLGVAVANRLPVLFPDTMAYNSAGEAVLGVFAGQDRSTRHAAFPARADKAAAADTGVSEARSPYYGLVLAVANRGGGVWLAATVQALVVAAALLAALRRLRLTGTAGMVTVAVAWLAGLAFYSVVLIPDVFLGPSILAFAFLLTGTDLSGRERLFWSAILLASLLFHRSFLAVALVLLVLGLGAWRAPWFARRGWTVAAAVTLAAVAGHLAVPVAVERVYGAKMASPPFLLARMIEGHVVPAYLADACPAHPYLLCRLRDRLPMDHDRFLWSPGPDAVFSTMSLADRLRLSAEAGPIIAGAVTARPVAAVAEAIDYSVRELFFAGMDDFTQRVPLRWHIDPSLVPAMAAYPASGIIAGDFPLHGFSRMTAGVYFAALAVLAAAAGMLARPARLGWVRTAPVDRGLVAAVAIIVAGLIVNAAVSGTLSGLRDRYTGRIAWLAPVAAAAALCHALAVTTRRRWDHDA